MKTKVKKILFAVLVFLLILSVFTGCGETSTNSQSVKDKWVLTKEEINYADGSESRKKLYQYDSLGRVIGLKESAETWSYEYKDIIHDNAGNITSYTEECIDYIFGDNVSYSYSFSYDENNNCVLTVKQGEYKLVTDYDENNNIMKETYSYPNDEITYVHSLTYKNDSLIHDEIEINDSTSTWYNLDVYSYDENNNLYTIKHYYGNDDNQEKNDNTIQLNGKYYELVHTNYHTWEKLNDIAVEISSNKVENKKNTILSEIGFNNIDEWGGKLIEIQSDKNENYVFEDSFGKYVIIQEGTIICEFYTEQSYVVMSSYYVNKAYSTEAAGTYTVLDNDTFSFNGNAIRILNRFIYDGFNVIDMTRGGSLSDIYIPYSILDIETIELYQENDRFDYYKCYLK